MLHPIYRVIDFKNIAPFVLRIKFDDGHEQEVDFRQVLVGELYGPLQDEKFFNQVEIDPEIHTLVWPNGADFDPETLHDWPKYVDEMAKLVRQAKTNETLAL
jgi:glycine/D-amino acid oxidase-like deaminating enzyme